MKSIFILLSLFVLISCGSEESAEQSYWTVDDVTKSEERIAVLLEEDPGILNMYVKGQADGTFQIIANGGVDNKMFQFRGGSIDTVISEHWKSATCKTIYVPKSISSGEISISTLIYPKE